MAADEAVEAATHVLVTAEMAEELAGLTGLTGCGLEAALRRRQKAAGSCRMAS